MGYYVNFPLTLQLAQISCLLRAHVSTWAGFFVQQHNQVAPHVALRGRTPEEAYFGLALDLPERLAEARARARQTRLEHNRALSCAVCTPRQTSPPTTDTRVGPREQTAGNDANSM